LLRDTALDVSQIAEMLDYAEASTFTRAFRRWSGSTPSAWRRQALARDAGRKAG
jgi:AraC-like DNA-binding protein